MLERMSQRIVSETAAAVDRAATQAAVLGAKRGGKRGRKGGGAESLSHEQRMEALGFVSELYKGKEDQIFREARKIVPEERLALPSIAHLARLAHLDGGRTMNLSWPSRYELLVPELAERYFRIANNETAHARLIAHRKPASVIILVHGYTSGQYVVEQRLWASDSMYRRGYDVAHFTLPFHAVRGDSRRAFPPFPSADPRLTIEGFRQTLGDLMDFIEWLLSQGHPSVGVMGMSLGGYTTSLLATLEKRLAFAVPVIPLASMADFAHDQGRLGSTPEEAERERQALENAYSVVSPLQREPLVPSERIRVIAGRGDRITPVAHARKLANHFDANVHLWPGGHLLQVGRKSAYRSVIEDLERNTGLSPN